MISTAEIKKSAANTQADQNTKKRISLVLGSGGAKGLAQIGVIRCLQDRGYDIRYIAGSSIGALIGGIHAAGKLDVYAEWVSALQKLDVVRLLDWSFDGGALFKGDRIISVLKDLIGDRNIEDLSIGFTAVCTNLSADASSREVWLNRGPLFDAIRASIAVPTVFEPVQVDGRLLVDGGVINPVPVAPTLNNRTELTVAVDLNGPRVAFEPLPEPEPPPPSALQLAYEQRIGRYLERFRPKPELPVKNQVGFSDVATRSMEVMQATLTQFKFAATPPTILIKIPHNLCSFFEFHRSRELIDYGYQETTRAIDSYRRSLDGS